jgi:hypothetical protein
MSEKGRRVARVERSRSPGFDVVAFAAVPRFRFAQSRLLAEDHTLVRCFLRIKDRQMKRHIVALVQCVADSQ